MLIMMMYRQRFIRQQTHLPHLLGSIEPFGSLKTRKVPLSSLPSGKSAKRKGLWI